MAHPISRWASLANARHWTFRRELLTSPALESRSACRTPLSGQTSLACHPSVEPTRGRTLGTWLVASEVAITCPNKNNHGTFKPPAFGVSYLESCQGNHQKKQHMILEQYNVVHVILTPKNWIPPYQPGPVLPHHLLQSPPICAGCKRHDQSVATAIGIPRHIPLLFGAEAQLHLWSFSYPHVTAANSSVNFPIFGDCGENWGKHPSYKWGSIPWWISGRWLQNKSYWSFHSFVFKDSSWKSNCWFTKFYLQAPAQCGFCRHQCAKTNIIIDLDMGGGFNPSQTF